MPIVNWTAFFSKNNNFLIILLLFCVQNQKKKNLGFAFPQFGMHYLTIVLSEFNLEFTISLFVIINK